MLAGGLGFEPRFSESESDVLPLNYPPIGTRCSYTSAEHRASPGSAAANLLNHRNSGRPGVLKQPGDVRGSDIGVVTHRHNISDIAKKAGIERSSLYRAFAGSPKHPNFKTVLSVLDAMGFQLHVTARGGERATPAHLASSSKAEA